MLEKNTDQKVGRSLWRTPVSLTFLFCSFMGIVMHCLLLWRSPLTERNLQSFSLGVGYDFMNGALLALLVLCILPLLPKVQKKVCAILVPAFLIFLFMDYHYVLQFGTHAPYSIIEYLDITEAGIFSSTAKSTFLSWSGVLFLFLPLGVFFLLLFWPPREREEQTLWKRIVDFLLSFLLLLLVGGGGGAYSNSYVTKNFHDPLTSAGINYFLVWTKNIEKEVEIEEPVKELKVVGESLHGEKTTESNLDQLPLLRKHKESSCSFSEKQSALGKVLCPTQGKEKPNLLLILLESFRAVDIGVYGSQLPLTPEFDKWSEKGVLFKNFYANGFQTRHGEVASYCSLMPNYGAAIMKRYTRNRFWCLPQQLKTLGYHTSWFHGSDAAFDGQVSFLPKIGFGKVVDRYSLPTDSEVLGWGYSDEATFEYWIKELKETPQPFFSSVLTITNHHPFLVPENYRLGKGDGDTEKYREAIYYTDAMLGKFLEKIQFEPWYQNSLIFITADTANYQEPQALPKDFEEFIRVRAQIPLLIVGGLVQEAQVIDDYASQIDLAPTILDFLGEEYQATWAGHSLLNRSSPFIAYTNRPGTYWGVMSQKGRYYKQNNQKDHHFGFEKESLKLKYQELGLSWIQSTKWLLQEDLYWHE